MQLQAYLAPAQIAGVFFGAIVFAAAFDRLQGRYVSIATLAIQNVRVAGLGAVLELNHLLAFSDL